MSRENRIPLHLTLILIAFGIELLAILIGLIIGFWLLAYIGGAIVVLGALIFLAANGLFGGG